MVVDILDFIRHRAGDYDCPVCRRSLQGCGLNVLRQEGPLYTIKVSCGGCDVSFVVVIQVRDDDVVAVLPSPKPAPAGPPGAVRDPISLDELLDVHEALRDLDGEIVDLFRPRAGSA